ncbi:MAG: hypothetical protein HPY59_17295 [Anaerolineae bacterium]|nr:hypothetical protein [Anaerolineae bacterium]
MSERVKMILMEEHQHLPDANRLSVLTSTILLIYALGLFIRVPAGDVSLQLPGIFVVIPLRFGALLTLLSGLLAAAGTEWLLYDHPERGGQMTWHHGLLPALTALVIGFPLSSISAGPQWWAVFAFGSGLLVIVFAAEYIVVDLSDANHPLATMVLTAISFALLLVITITLKAVGTRLYLLLPGLVIPVALVSLRTLYLRLGGRWCIVWSIAIALSTGQIALGLHYWPLRPLSYGLLVLGPAYALTMAAGAIEEERSWRTLWIEPVVMLAVIWGIALFIVG